MADKLKPLLYFVKEREAIRKKREAGNPQPWTKDPILAQYRFCNVRRQGDRVSRWLIENVLTEENIDQNIESFLEFSAWCRFINWPPTIKAVIDAGLYPTRNERVNWVRVGRLVDRLGESGKAWTGAYIIRAPRTPGLRKGKFVSQEVIGKHFRKGVSDLISIFASSNPGMPATYQEVWQALRRVPNMGPFMSGQIAGDWTYTSLLRAAPDLKTWAPMGPGSIRGFNRVIGLTPITKRPSEELWLKKLTAWRQIIIDKLGPEYDDLDLLSVQNTLCETDKWLRVKNGEGRPRATYKSHTY
jgi:hypothetical protein